MENFIFLCSEVCQYSLKYTINHNKNEAEIGKRLHRCDINRLRSRNGHKHSKYKKFPST